MNEMAPRVAHVLSALRQRLVRADQCLIHAAIPYQLQVHQRGPNTIFTQRCTFRRRFLLAMSTILLAFACLALATMVAEVFISGQFLWPLLPAGIVLLAVGAGMWILYFRTPRSRELVYDHNRKEFVIQNISGSRRDFVAKAPLGSCQFTVVEIRVVHVQPYGARKGVYWTGCAAVVAVDSQRFFLACLPHLEDVKQYLLQLPDWLRHRVVFEDGYLIVRGGVSLRSVVGKARRRR